MDRNWFEGLAGDAPTVAVDEIVRLHFEKDWREYFEVADFHPVYLLHMPERVKLEWPHPCSSDLAPG